MLRDYLCFISVRFAIIKYTSKSDKKISVIDWLTDRQTDGLTDICISRAAFAAENCTNESKLLPPITIVSLIFGRCQVTITALLQCQVTSGRHQRWPVSWWSVSGTHDRTRLTWVTTHHTVDTSCLWSPLPPRTTPLCPATLLRYLAPMAPTLVQW